MKLLNSSERGLAAIEVVFSLPVILLSMGVTVYVGTMMKTRLELLGVVQQIAQRCSRGQTDLSAPNCVVNQQADVETRLERCNNLALVAEIQTFGIQDFSQVETGTGERGTLGNRNEVGLDLLSVTGTCDVEVGYPLPFVEFDQLSFDLTEVAAMPLRLERSQLP